MATTRTAVFIYGGTADGKTGLDDFWEFTNGRWSAVTIAGTVRPPAGFGFDLCWYPPAVGEPGPGSLLLTGGSEGEFVFYRFYLLERRWEIVRPTELKLPAYTGHKVFPLDDGCGLILGGHTATRQCNNHVIWFSAFGQLAKVLLCSGMPPLGRILTNYTRIGNRIFLVGGQDEFQSFILDLTTWTWSLPRNLGIKNSCPSFYGAASVSDRSTVYIYGGINDTDDTQPLVFMVTLNMKHETSPQVACSGEDCVRDEWGVNLMANPGTPKDEVWIGEKK
jgi:hypothetical protein